MQYHDTKQIEGMVEFYGVAKVRKQVRGITTQQIAYHDYKELESLIAYYGRAAVNKQINLSK